MKDRLLARMRATGDDLVSEMARPIPNDLFLFAANADRVLRSHCWDRQGGQHEPASVSRDQLHNYCCFLDLKLSLEEDTTVLFAENGGGKTALLTEITMGLAVFQTGAPRNLKLDSRRDPTMRTLDDKVRCEPVGKWKLASTAAVGDSDSATWSATANPAGRRTTTQR